MAKPNRTLILLYALRTYIILSQGRLYNPRLAEMLDELIQVEVAR